MKTLLSYLGVRTGPVGDGTPWYVDLFLAIGGWVAGILAAIAIFALGFAVFAGGGVEVAWFALAAGAGFIAAGLALGGGGGFSRNFSVALVGAGLTAFAGGLTWIFTKLFGDAKQSVGASLLAASAAHAVLAAFTARRLNDRILTFLATLGWASLAGAGVALMFEKGDAWTGAPVTLFTAACAVAGAVLFIGPGGFRLPAVGAALLTGPIIAGEMLRSVSGAGSSLGLSGLIAEGAYAATILYGLFALRGRAPFTGLLAAGVPLFAFVWFLPDSGAAAAAALVVGMAAGSRGLAAIGVIALTFFIARFYYDLSLPLLTKSALLGGLGVATILIAEGLRRFGTRDDIGRPAFKDARRSIAASLAFGALLLASTLLVNKQVFQLERDFSNARSVYFPLAPVDPRSIMQGDYMALNFDRALFPPESESLGRAGEVFLSIDARGVARFSRLALPDDAPRTDELRVDYRRDGVAVRYCPETFFFQEGEAALFAAARFAIVKVAPDGKTRLVALAEENLSPIQPPPHRTTPN